MAVDVPDTWVWCITPPSLIILTVWVASPAMAMPMALAASAFLTSTGACHFGEINAVGTGHHDVAEEGRDFRCPFQQRQRFIRAAAFDQMASQALQLSEHDAPHLDLVFHEQDKARCSILADRG